MKLLTEEYPPLSLRWNTTTNYTWTLLTDSSTTFNQLLTVSTSCPSQFENVEFMLWSLSRNLHRFVSVDCMPLANNIGKFATAQFLLNETCFSDWVLRLSTPTHFRNSHEYGPCEYPIGHAEHCETHRISMTPPEFCPYLSLTIKMLLIWLSLLILFCVVTYAVVTVCVNRWRKIGFRQIRVVEWPIPPSVVAKALKSAEEGSETKTTITSAEPSSPESVTSQSSQVPLLPVVSLLQPQLDFVKELLTSSEDDETMHFSKSTSSHPQL